ncbi:MAG: hypothetical protein IMW89_15690, partial [Ktedonobacteraceae bacterium]|nr:hypothetical protein [Ktedonobacteraceae bacterium]
MNTCSFCHARLAAGTGVCSICGRTTSASGAGDFPPEAPPIVPLSDPSHAPTFLQGNDLPTVQLSPGDAETMRRQSRTAGAVPDTYSGASTVTMPTDPASPEPSLKGKQEEEEEDEEK